MDTQYQCRPDESNSSRYILEDTRLDSVTDKEKIARQRAKEERDNRLHRFRTDPSFDPDKLTSTDIAWVAAQKELDIDTVKKILYLERQETLKKEQIRKTEIKKRAQDSIYEINCKLFKISISLIVACLVFAFFAGPIARRCYAHEVTEEISTYICYVTEYGDCYHEKGCQYLWNSSYKTTVYSAEKRGYDPCSKCNPSQQTTLTFTKTLYWNISKTKTSENEPSFMLWLCCSLCLIPIYFLLTFNLKKKRKEEYYWIESTK